MGRGRVQAIIAAAVVVWAALLVLQGVTLRLAYLRPYSLVVGIVLLLFSAFDRWLWRLPPIARLMARPVLVGTWKGELRSNWIDPETKEAIPPVPAFMLIRQTYDSLTLRLFTAESFSRSDIATIQESDDGVPEIVTTYQNLPQLHLRERSPVHYGAMRLQVHGKPAFRLQGFYWTDRSTKGEALFTAHVPQEHSDFASAWAAMSNIPAASN